MGTFILLLFIFFIVIPVCKLLWRGWQFHRRWKDATAGLRDAYARAYGQQAGNSTAGQSRRKKKKIDPDVGEYVAFEEIHATSPSDTATPPPAGDTGDKGFRAEPQVEDAVWEDVK
ncbi:MAG: DUF4834 family protein [Muribaculaceae bacterium]|nr:DUF4834 family protein [Muribaculaceae bacterium]